MRGPPASRPRARARHSPGWLHPAQGPRGSRMPPQAAAQPQGRPGARAALCQAAVLSHRGGRRDP
eukprot:201673-Alexandrium_andersonii.AAC.1